MQPMTKNDVGDKIKNREFPAFVIQAFNECIEEAKINHSSDVMQNDVIERIMKLSDSTRNQIFENHWLDIEDTFRKAGWQVSYYKPNYNESEPAYFTFT